MKLFTALMIDLENSREYKRKDREEIQGRLKDCVYKLNTAFERELACPVEFSGGDELQGLFRHTASAVLYWRYLSLFLGFVPIRAGMGVGEWSLRLPGNLSTEQDGSAYHRARQAIKKVHREKDTQIWLISAGDFPEADVLGNYLLNCSNWYLRDQTPEQRILLVLMEYLCPFRIGTLPDAETFDALGEIIWKGYDLEDKPEGQWDWLEIMPGRQKEWIDIIPGRMQDTDVVEKRGTASRIAEIIGRTRQNVDMGIRRGHSMDIRVMDFMALQTVARDYDERGSIR